MNTTKHASFRSIKRNLDKGLAEIALKEGKRVRGNRDRILVTEEIVRSLRDRQSYSKKLIKKAEKAAPFVCVIKDDTVITMFRHTKRLNKRHMDHK